MITSEVRALDWKQAEIPSFKTLEELVNWYEAQPRRPEGIEEQFEYYDYRYFHRRMILANTHSAT